MQLNEDAISIEILNEQHIAFYTPIFNCLNPVEFNHLPRREKRKFEDLSKSMNAFINNEAFEEQVAGLNKTFLLFYDLNLVGYISLCADSINLGEDEKKTSELPYATVPAIKVARLAIDYRFQKKGLGKYLIDFAISRAFKVREEYCGVKFLTVDCYEHRVSYYQKLKFSTNGMQIIEDARLTSLNLDIDQYLDTIEI